MFAVTLLYATQRSVYCYSIFSAHHSGIRADRSSFSPLHTVWPILIGARVCSLPTCRISIFVPTSCIHAHQMSIIVQRGDEVQVCFLSQSNSVFPDVGRESSPAASWYFFFACGSPYPSIDFHRLTKAWRGTGGGGVTQPNSSNQPHFFCRWRFKPLFPGSCVL